jgi:hypothetical protein
MFAEAPLQVLDPKAGEADNLHIRLDEAVLSLTRATLSAGVRLIVAGDPEICLFAAAVANEYRSPGREEQMEPSMVIYLPPQDADALEKEFSSLLPRDMALVCRIDVDHGMIVRQTQPDALVCIGGREENTYRLVEVFHNARPAAPIYALETTGGVARSLVRRRHEYIRVRDQEFSGRQPDFDEGPAFSSQSGYQYSQSIPPYPIIMQQIIREIYRFED